MQISFRRLAMTAVPKVSSSTRPRLDFSATPERISSLTESLISSTKQLYDEIAQIANPTVENVIGPLHRQSFEAYIENTNIEFLQHVHPDKATRDASTEADKRLSEFFVTQEMRTDVYAVIQKLNASLTDPLDAETRRYLDRLVRDGRRSGLHLDAETRAQLETIKKRISEVSILFNKNISEENTEFFFSREELVGVDAAVLDNLPRQPDGKLKVSLKYPDYRPVMRKCQVPETRRQLELAFNSRCRDVNSPLLAELIGLRRQEAQLLHFPSHADYISEIRMAKSASNIRTFIDELFAKVAASGSAKKELDAIRAVRASITEEPVDTPLHLADLAFYRNLVLERNFQIDQTLYQQYFPLEHVTKEMLTIYEEILNLKFVQVPTTTTTTSTDVSTTSSATTTMPVWHEDVLCYGVYDASGSSSEPLGYFYLDLHPREGKYSHAALFPLQPSAEYAGERTEAVCSLVCNFTKPGEGGRPSLLTHEEVTTYFHEFGHCMHHICAQKPRYPRFSGTSVERDFVECPSQMLENWCWEKEALGRLSRHFQTGESLSSEMIEKLIASRNADEGMHTLQQLCYASFDQAIHGEAEVVEGVPVQDVASIYKYINKKYTGLDVTESTCMPASFGHMVGYSASYIGYLWSEVYSADAFVSKFRGRLFDPAVGKEYRDKILAPGGSKDGADMIREFLGREPSIENFLKLKGM